MSCARSDTKEKCGGRDRMSVYEMKDKDDKDKSYESEGCYKDNSRNRIMSKMYSDRPMSAKVGCTHFAR